MNAPRFDIAAALKGEAALPTNCFSMDGIAVLSEGFRLDFHHPLAGGNIALILGENGHVRRNFQHGCLYQAGGFVRRAVIEWCKPEGKKPFPLLTQPASGQIPKLLHINWNMPEGIRPLMNFSAGIKVPAKNIIARSGTEALLSLGDRENVLLFCGDGRVVRVVCKGDTLSVEKLSIEEQTKLRIEYVKNKIEELKSSSRSVDQKVAVEDGYLHQIISMMIVGAKYSEAAFEMAFEFLEEAGKRGELRKGVRWRATDVLARQGHAVQCGFLKAATSKKESVETAMGLAFLHARLPTQGQHA